MSYRAAKSGIAAEAQKKVSRPTKLFVMLRNVTKHSQNFVTQWTFMALSFIYQKIDNAATEPS